MLDIVSLLQTKIGGRVPAQLQSESPEPETETSADLYECSACEAVLIEPPNDTCPKCHSGSLEKV